MHNCVILHVEDDDAFSFILQEAAQEAGLNVQIYRVSDGEQALLFLKKRPPYERARTPKLVLMDLNMPRVSGWEVLAESGKDLELQKVPFVVLSTGFARDNKVRAIANGAQRYIEKPDDFDELIRQIQTHCAPFIIRNRSICASSLPK